jgi:hypothetical protein
MTVVRSFTAAATFAAIAVGGAGAAWAAPTMNGHYTYTSTGANGQSVTSDWYVTPCGDGCVTVTTNAGAGEARFVNGQWTGDANSDAKCPDGTVVPNAFSNHCAWDPNTLAGTVAVTYNVEACGAPAGATGTNRMQLRPAP